MNPFEHALAYAEEALAQAQQRYEEAGAEVAKIQTRIAAVNQRRESIKNDLAAGNLDDKAAGGLLHAANEDLSDLSRLLAQAEGARTAIEPKREREKLAEAKANLEQYIRQGEFDVLHSHVKNLESTFVNALGELYAMGRSLGRPSPLSSVWHPSEGLDRAMRYGVPPSVQR